MKAFLTLATTWFFWVISKMQNVSFYFVTISFIRLTIVIEFLLCVVHIKS